MNTAPPASHGPIEAPKGVAVFLCGCAGKVSSKVDMEALLSDALKHPTVKSVEVMDNCCCQEDLDRMRLSLSTEEIDRFIVAGCSWQTSGQRFVRLAEESGVDPSLVEVCNLKEHCALVHGQSDATHKARRLLQISLARADTLQAGNRKVLERPDMTVLVAGNGSAALTAARGVISMGHDALLVYPGESLFISDETESIGLEDRSLASLTKEAGERLTLSSSSRLMSLRGSPGAFLAMLETPLGETEVMAGAVILAMDEEPAENPLRSRFGDKAVTQAELESMLNANRKTPKNVVMLAMDESGKSDFDPMSTHEAVHNGLFLRTLNPKSSVIMITREVFALGQCEAGYRKAMESGVRVLRTDRFPKIGNDHLTVHDVHLGQAIEVPYDLIVLDNATAIPEMAVEARAAGIPLTGEGRLKRPNAKLKPSESIRPGVFICGTATERNLGIGPTLEARSAVSLACAMLRGPIITGGDVAEVWQELCSACLTCVRTCPYSAPYIDGEGKACIRVELCQGCGVCVGICPSKAIQMLSFRDDQIAAQIEKALGGMR